MRARGLALLAAVAAGCLACASPEADRARGGGSGSDVGNRNEGVVMHEGSRPYWRTPRAEQVTAHPDLEPARQADRLSRR
jgi:hypothetical protein